MSVFTSRFDGWSNTTTFLGTSRDKQMAHDIRQYPALIQPDKLEALWLCDDIAATIVEAPIHQAMTLGGYPTFAEDMDRSLSEAAEKWDVFEKVTQAAIWGRLFGGGAILMGVDRGLMHEALDVETVQEGDLLYLDVIDRRDLNVNTRYTDPLMPEWGQPETYQINRSSEAGSTTTVVHESRLVVFGGALTSERIRIQNGGWDVSVLQRIWEVLRSFDQTWKSVDHLLAEMSQAVFKVQGLLEQIAEGDIATMQTRMGIADRQRSVSRAVLLDADMEDFTTVGAQNVSGIAPILQEKLKRLAGAARMPVTVLMGLSPAGLNATGESDTRSWFNVLTFHREMGLAPRIIELMQVVARSEGAEMPERGIRIEWPSLWIMSPSEEAAHRKAVADTDSIYIRDQVVLPEEVTVARWGRGTYSDELVGAVDTEAREELGERGIDMLIEDSPAQVSPQVMQAMIDALMRAGRGEGSADEAMRTMATAFGMTMDEVSEVVSFRVPTGQEPEPEPAPEPAPEPEPEA